MNREKPIDVLRRFNANLDKATDILNGMSRFIQQLESTLHVLEEHKDALKKDAAVQAQLSSCDEKILSLKSAINRLEEELSDTQVKIDRVQI